MVALLFGRSTAIHRAIPNRYSTTFNEDVMKLIGSQKENFVVEMDASELRAVLTSLAHVLVVPPLPGVTHVLPRVGATTAEVEALRKGLCEANGTALHRFSFSRSDLLIIVRALDELANGVQILDWEFQSLTGFDRDAVREHLRQFHRLLANRGRDLEALAEREHLGL
jgi:hypothetical protein